MTPLVALTIAGSDSGSGAGIQADLKTFAAHGLFGTCVISAVTAQDTAGVAAVAALDPAFVLTQLTTVVSDLPPAAVKTGMLANPAIVTVVAEAAARGGLPNLVVDPVLVSTSGHRLMEDGGVGAYRDLLFPLASVVTPNLHEAALLAGQPFTELSTLEAVVKVAEALRSLGPGTVVVKGGHLPAAGRDDLGSPDVVAGPTGTEVLYGPRVSTTNDHGTGCTLSAAIAARLALGEGVLEAVKGAKAYVAQALAGSARWHLGRGHGPIDHFGWTGPPVAGADDGRSPAS